MPISAKLAPVKAKAESFERLSKPPAAETANVTTALAKSSNVNSLESDKRNTGKIDAVIRIPAQSAPRAKPSVKILREGSLGVIVRTRSLIVMLPQ